MDFVFTWGFIIPAGILLVMYGNFRSVHAGFKKYKYPNSSSLNPVRVSDGLVWSSFDKIKHRFRKKTKHDFYIGQFRFSPKTLKECRPPYLYRKRVESTQIWLDRMDMKQTTMVWGGMKSGKSVFFTNLLSQSHCYENALVHDGGKLEMVSKFYNPLRDIVLNPYDERATIHDLLSEDTAIQKQFFKLLLSAASGEGKVNFFTTGAMEHLQNITLLVQRQNFTTAKEKWAYFIHKIDELILETQNDSQRSEGDVVATLKQVLSPFYLMNFRIQDGAETFVVEDFLKRSHGAKLYVSYPPMLTENLASLSSAFIALYTLIHLSQPDTKKKFYFYLIDEFSSYLRMLNNEDILKDQLEKLRSKGGMYCGGLQGEEEKDAISQIIDKTIQNKFYFRTDGTKTKETAIRRAGKFTYEIQNLQKEGRGLNIHKINTYSEQSTTRDVIVESDFNGLGEKHEYIAMLDTHNLYRGYTPLPPEELDFEERKNKNPGLNEEDLQRAKGYVEYKKRREFEDMLATRYEQVQNAKFQKNREKAAAKKVV